MYTNNIIRLHEKCQLIMALIQRVSNRLERLKARFAFYENKSLIAFAGQKNILKIHIENNEAIIERLTRYYVRNFTLLSDEVLEQCFPKKMAS